MPIVIFEREGQAGPLAIVEAMPGDKLIDVARFHDLPLLWRCGQGTCGTCKLHVTVPAGSPDWVLGRMERNVLLREKLIDTAAAVTAEWPADCGRWRLACHTEVGEADMTVCLPVES
jgi:ferredoxin